MTTPRFEIVHTDAGWHARFRATNSRIVWTTEVYTSHRAARQAIEMLANTAAGVPVCDVDEHTTPDPA